MTTLVFRKVQVLDPACPLDPQPVDVVVERGLIQAVGPEAGAGLLSSERVRVVQCDAATQVLVPGFLDLHTHLRDPGSTHKEDIASGLRAAAAGGFVDVCVMANTLPVNDTPSLTEQMVQKARALGGCRLHPIAAITVGLQGESLTDMASLQAAGAVAVSDDGRCVTSSRVMLQALQYASTFGLPVIQHAEDHALTAGAQMHEGAISTQLGLRGWPRVAEDVIVARDLLLAEYTKARYHVAHLSTQGALRLMREAKSRGLAVTAEVTPHHLMLTDHALLGYNTACKVNPPLREEEDVEALREGLADGTIDCIATDHAPHSALEKDCPFDMAAPGMVGLELCIPVLLDLVHRQKLPLPRLIDALTRGPARAIGLPVPSLRPGARADLTLLDLHTLWTLDATQFLSKSRNTPFQGRQVRGKVLCTVAEGHMIFDGLCHDPCGPSLGS